MRGRTIETQPTNAVFVFTAQMMNRKKTIEYNNDTENYSIEQRTTVNLTSFRSWAITVADNTARNQTLIIHMFNFMFNCVLYHPIDGLKIMCKATAYFNLF